MKIRTSILLALLVAAISCTSRPEVSLADDPVEYVSTLVGTQSDFTLSTGNTYPAIALPWGMNFWTPQTGKNGNGWAYTYNAHTIRGFKQTHQPSPWINDYGQFSLMPVRDASRFGEEERQSIFSHQSETAKPYYYQVYLADSDVNVEITPTERAAVLRFTFPDSETSGIVIDAFDHGSSVKVDKAAGKVTGYTTRNSRGVPENFRNWFTLTFDKAIESFDIYDGDKNVGGNEYTGDHAIAVVKFKTVRGEKVNVKVASSFISPEQAEVNLKEVAGKDFETVKGEAKDSWNKILGRIKVGGGTVDQYRTFYSCLYRSTLFPRKFYEISAEGKPIHYSPYDGKVHDGYMYTDNGFWDTFRAQFPLLNLVFPDINEEIQKGMACIAKENPFLPEWASPGHRNCMVGNNSASIVADAILLGVNTEELETLYNTLVYGAHHNHPFIKSTGRYGHEYYDSLGYVPYNVGINENVARTLEYAYDDWCILQVAKKLGRPEEEINKYTAHALNYRNVFDPETKLMRGKNDDGTFVAEFSPYKWGDAYTEGNAWHYTWSVFHDPQGLIDLMGGDREFTRMLDSVFIVPPIYDDSYYRFRIHEIAEMQVANMGNYAHGNQPAQHMIYLYDWAREPWKTQQHVREVMNKLYTAKPDGYCGDEDNGQTSAWYVFSALGFYPVCPGSGQYAVGSPLFKKAVVTRPDGKQFTIDAPANSHENVYVTSMTLNGKNWDRNFLTWDDLTAGAKISYTMASKPDTNRGTSDEAKPYSFSNELKTK